MKLRHGALARCRWSEAAEEAFERTAAARLEKCCRSKNAAACPIENPSAASPTTLTSGRKASVFLSPTKERASERDSFESTSATRGHAMSHANNELEEIHWGKD